MIADQLLSEAIDKSPLSVEDKEHWKSLLPKLDVDQRERLHHSLSAKTEITRAINLIEKALKIITEAEAEAEAEVTKEEEQKSEREALMKELEAIKDAEEKILLDEDSLKKKHQETKEAIDKIRQELHNLSVEVHGAPPPSYSGQPSQPIPQLEK